MLYGDQGFPGLQARDLGILSDCNKGRHGLTGRYGEWKNCRPLEHDMLPVVLLAAHVVLAVGFQIALARLHPHHRAIRLAGQVRRSG